MVTPWAKGWRPPPRPLMTPKCRGDRAPSAPQVRESLRIPSGLPRDPQAPSPPPGPGSPLRAALRGSGLLSPWCGSAAPHRRSRGYSQPGGLQQPLTPGPGGSPAPEWSCSPSLQVVGVFPTLHLQPLTHGPEGSCSPSPTGLEPLLPPKGPVAPHQQFWSPPGHRAAPGLEPAASPPRRRARVPSPERRGRSRRPPKPRGTPAQPRALGACP